METLAVVAYRQPVLRAEIEAIRGVQCGEILRQLMERDLVRIAGRSEELGRPLVYGTTRRFLQTSGSASSRSCPAGVCAIGPAAASITGTCFAGRKGLSAAQDPNRKSTFSFYPAGRGIDRQDPRHPRPVSFRRRPSKRGWACRSRETIAAQAKDDDEDVEESDEDEDEDPDEDEDDDDDEDLDDDWEEVEDDDDEEEDLDEEEDEDEDWDDDDDEDWDEDEDEDEDWDDEDERGEEEAEEDWK